MSHVCSFVFTGDAVKNSTSNQDKRQLLVKLISWLKAMVLSEMPKFLLCSKSLLCAVISFHDVRK